MKKVVIGITAIIAAATGYVIGRSTGYKEASVAPRKRKKKTEDIELSYVMPCYNEAETIGQCIDEAFRFLKENNISGEVLVVDNNSTDDSVAIAEAHGARVITEKVQGYGSALRAGIKAAYGEFIIMGDADMSYDFYHVNDIMARLYEGYDLVMGRRIPEKGATPWIHKYIGVPALSMMARIRFGCYITDYHCGIRGMNAEVFKNFDFTCTGMEFATEMIAVAHDAGCTITQVDVPLRKDGRSVPPKLDPIRDGFRHMKYIFIDSFRKSEGQ